MITAVDTNVLLDVFLPAAAHHVQSREALSVAHDAGGIIICDIVYAELAPAFSSREALDEALRGIDVTLSPVDASIAWEGGRRWMRYRRAGGPRQRILADFLIGAHALATADRFLTRDQGFYATYFSDLDKPSPAS